jgi:hypothetical protein
MIGLVNSLTVRKEKIQNEKTYHIDEIEAKKAKNRKKINIKKKEKRQGK